MDTRTEQVQAPDGGAFDAHVVIPDGGHGPGVLLIQEVFGVNAYIRSVAERLALSGYVVLAPDVFWRVQPNTEIDSSDPANIQPAIEIAGAWDPDLGLDDLEAAYNHLRELPETTGALAVMGFCFGGTQTYRLCKRVHPACSISYYGSGIAGDLDDIDEVTTPLMFHFGDNDPFIPNEEVDAIKAAAVGNPHVTVHVHEGAGHAFDNHLAPHFSQPDAARAAWTQSTMELYARIGGLSRGA